MWTVLCYWFCSFWFIYDCFSFGGSGVGVASERPWNTIGAVSERHESFVRLISEYFLSGMGPVSMTILQLSMVVSMTILYLRMVMVHMTWFSMSSPLLVRAWAWGGVRL